MRTESTSWTNKQRSFSRDRKRFASRALRFESLEPRRLLTTVNEVENNDSIAMAQPVALGHDSSEFEHVTVVGTAESFQDEVDFFAIQLNPGDIIGAAVNGGADFVTLRDPASIELISSTNDLVSVDEPQLPRGRAAVSYVADQAGTYYVSVGRGVPGQYSLDLNVFRPVLESSVSHQKVYLDFDGATTGPPLTSSPETFAPLEDSLVDFGLVAAGADQATIDAAEDALIQRIIDVVTENFSSDVRQLGTNGDFNASGIPGRFDLEILNSRDTPTDPFGQPNVSRVVIGVPPASFSDIGRAQSVDQGNFNTEDSAYVNLRVLSSPAGERDSLNTIGVGPEVTRNDFIGLGIANIVSHEMAHMFGSQHTNARNETKSISDPANIFDPLTILGNMLGLVGSVFGDGDGDGIGENDVDLRADEHWEVSTSLGPSHRGIHNTLNRTSHLLATPVDYFNAPRVAAVSIAGPNDLDGVDGVYSIPSGTGAQIQTVPVGGSNQIKITFFSEDVVLTGQELTVTSAITGIPYALDPFSFTTDFDTDTDTATWTLANGEYFDTADQIILKLDGSDSDATPGIYVRDTAGNILDGDWTNPTNYEDNTSADGFDNTNRDGGVISHFPSGDDSAGGDFEFYFTILPGDADTNNDVTGLDFSILSSNFNTLGGWKKGNFNGVVQGSADVNGLDFSILSSNFEPDPDFKEWYLPPQASTVSSDRTPYRPSPRVALEVEGSIAAIQSVLVRSDLLANPRLHYAPPNDNPATDIAVATEIEQPAGDFVRPVQRGFSSSGRSPYRDANQAEVVDSALSSLEESLRNVESGIENDFARWTAQ